MIEIFGEVLGLGGFSLAEMMRLEASGAASKFASKRSVILMAMRQFQLLFIQLQNAK